MANFTNFSLFFFFCQGNLWKSSRNVISSLSLDRFFLAKSTVEFLLDNAFTTLCMRNVRDPGWKTLLFLQVYFKYISFIVFQPNAISNLEEYYLLLVQSFHILTYRKIGNYIMILTFLHYMNFSFLKYVDFFFHTVI